jgi:hypothetical protein
MYALAACCSGLCCNSRKKVAGCGELMMTRRLSLCGCWAAMFQASAPPQSCAISASGGPPS